MGSSPYFFFPQEKVTKTCLPDLR